MHNLYGAAQSKVLPEKEFYWLNEDEIDQLDFMNIADDSDTGYILELRLKKIHRALGFKQSPWLKPYIDLNTEKRKDAQNSFEKAIHIMLYYTLLQSKR